MPESLGARLRQQREERQIALSTIADQTKIKLSLLEGLERDDASRWPSGIFRRAFIRTYADAIGLQPDVVVREFLERHPDPLEEFVPAVLETAADAASANAAPPTRLRHLVGAAVGSLSRLRAGTAPKRPVATDNPIRPDDVAADLPSPSDAPRGIVASASGTPLAAASEQELPADGVVAPAPVTSASASAGPDQAQGAEVGSAWVGRPPASAEPDLSAAASLCTELGRVDDARSAAPLLEELARLIDAVGLIVWVWDPHAAELTPALPYGYSDRVVAQLPNVSCDARNATAAAFRSGQMSVVSGGGAASDALVVPLMAPAGCAGVLAIELRHGRAGSESIRALATIFAAQMARVVGAIRPAVAANRRLA